MEDRRYRLGHRQGDRWVAYRHAATFEAGDRVIAGIPSSDPGVFQSLVSLLRGPLRLLYVLHTPRGEAAAGRYESPEVSVEQTSLFIRRFSDFLAADGRFDLWVHSATDHATLVWDRHDQLFGYGPVDLFVSRLREMGFVAGRVQVPGQHEHHYRAEMDVHAVDLLAAFDWRHSPLRPEDEQ